MGLALQRAWQHDRSFPAFPNGSPFILATPAADMYHRLTGYGYVVYYFPDEAHQIAVPAEDHTPYSETNWPGEQPYPHGMAIDIMPPDPALKLPSLAQLGAQMYADRQAGLPGIAWLKYQNWTDAHDDCWHDKWQPEHERSGSDDEGHIHQSVRTDFVNSNAAQGYDPVARVRGKKGTRMRCYKASDNGTLYLGDGMTSRTNFSLAQFHYMVDLGLIEPPPPGQPTDGTDTYGRMIWVLIPGEVENYAGVHVPFAGSGPTPPAGRVDLTDQSVQAVAKATINELSVRTRPVA